MLEARVLTDHIVAEDDPSRNLEIHAIDAPGAGGASHHYQIGHQDMEQVTNIVFQNGPIQESGVNGLTQESLLAIVIDRLRSFQAGPFPCRDNAIAMRHCEFALEALQRRTRDRLARGVEGRTQA